MRTNGYVTVFEASQRLRVSEARIRSWIARDLLKAKGAGGRLDPHMVDLADVAKLMTTRAAVVAPR